MAPSSPRERAARLDRVLEHAERLLDQVSEDWMDHRPPPGGRTLRDLGYGLFRGALAFVEAMDTGRAHERRLEEAAPEDLRDGAAIARYGALVRARLGGWFEGAGAGEYQRAIDTDDGPRSGDQVLDAALFGAARRLRDLHAALTSLGLAPGPLPAADVAGAPPGQSSCRTTRNP